jgi:DNA recombination protein RmuC
MDGNTVYIILGILIGVIIMLIVLLMKSSKSTSDTDTVERLGKFENDILEALNTKFSQNSELMNTKFSQNSETLNTKLSQGSDKVNQIMQDVIERLTVIDEAQKQMKGLSTSVGSLQSILTDKKTRGIYGETTLKHVVTNVFGENDRLYKLQYSFDSGRIADCVIFAPEPIGILAIDSKFPLENYNQMMRQDITDAEQRTLTSLFKQDVKKHINAIADKYIIPNVTANEAIMFVPAEAIFAEINAYHEDLIDYAATRHVWICSPTTLMATLTTMQMAILNIEQSRNATIIQQELLKLKEQFEKYDARWENLTKHINNVSKDVDSLNITGKKISKRFAEIEKVKLDAYNFSDIKPSDLIKEPVSSLQKQIDFPDDDNLE